MAKIIAKKAALRVPIDSGTKLILASDSSLPEEACQMYSGLARPSYQTFSHRELKEISGCLFHTSASFNVSSSFITSIRPLIGETARWLIGKSLRAFCNNVRDEVP